MNTALTWIGLAVTLWGVGCGLVAYLRTWREHGSGDLWPLGAVAVRQTKGWMLKLVPWRRRPQVIQVSSAVEVSSAGSVRAIKSGLPVPEDLAIPEQIRLIVRRIAQVEFEAAEDRRQYKAEFKTLRSEAGELAVHLRQADRNLEVLARSVAVSTARLQMGGLVLVGCGTVLMAVPTIFNL